MAGSRSSPVRSERSALVWLLAASIVFTIGDGSVQLLLAPHLQAQGVGSAAIGPIVAAYSVAALCFRFVTGWVYRAHLIRFLVPGGCVLQTVSFLWLANASSPLPLAVATATNGMGFAIASTGGLAAVMELRQRGNAGVVMGWYTGCLGAGYSLAGFVGGAAGDLLGLSRAITTLAILPLLAGVGLAVAVWHVEGQAPTPTRTRGGPLAVLTGAGPYVWLAFFCALHINLLSGVLLAFFPLYGLAIGISLTQVGTLTGMSSGVSSAIRFSAPALFRRVSYRSLLPWMVLLGSIATAALTLSAVYALLAAAWIGIGVSRGILRVSSAALVMDTNDGSDRGRGAASGLYLAGLDVGKIIGPIAGGAAVSVAGYRVTFLLAGLAVPLVFFAFYAVLTVRERAATTSPT